MLQVAFSPQLTFARRHDDISQKIELFITSAVFLVSNSENVHLYLRRKTKVLFNFGGTLRDVHVQLVLVVRFYSIV
jgi:hypothetical protein